MSARRLYATPLPIGPNRHPHDQVRDAESFCRRYLDDAFDGWGMYLRPEDYDDSLSLLITHLWRLSERFDPGRNDSFANYARSIIRKRAADVGPRRLLGRNGSRLNEYQHDELDTSTPGSHTRETQSLEQSNPDPYRGTDDRRVLDDRDRQRAWAANVLGVRTAQLAA